MNPSTLCFLNIVYRQERAHPHTLCCLNLQCKRRQGLSVPSQGFIQWGGGAIGGPPPPPPPTLIKSSIKISHQFKPLAFVFDQKIPEQSGGIKEILLKIRPKELGVLNMPTHLLCFHPKFLSLDETLPQD